MECIHPSKNEKTLLQVTHKRVVKRIDPCSITYGPSSVSVCRDSLAKVSAHNGLLVVSSGGIDVPPLSGDGTRMFFYTPRGAFRAGGVNGTQWDIGNIGPYSFASGLDTVASSSYSHAEGKGTVASGSYAHAEGLDTLAQGTESHAEGRDTIAKGDASHAEGQSNYASGRTCHVEGLSNTGDGDGCHVEGQLNNIIGSASHGEGVGNYLEGIGAHVEGNGNTGSGDGNHIEGSGNYVIECEYSHTEGLENDNHAPYSHVEGSDNYAGLYAIYSHTEGESNDNHAENSHVEGYRNTVGSESIHSHTEGESNTNHGENCHVEGYYNIVVPGSVHSHTEGLGNSNNAQGSHIEGDDNESWGDYSHIGGSSNKTEIDTDNSFAHGLGLTAKSRGVFIIGQYGDSIGVITGATGIATGAGPYTINPEYSFQIAGGIDGSGGVSVVIGTRAFGENPVGGGISSFWQVKGSDYAEYFEWEDGNPDNEDRVGYFVELFTDTIKKAEDSSKVLGITSDISGVIGDSAELAWSGCYKTDKLMRPHVFHSHKIPIKEFLKGLKSFPSEDLSKIQSFEDTPDILSKILIDIPSTAKYADKLRSLIPLPCVVPSADYDSSRPYIPRSRRKEWIKVGLVGKIPVRDDGSCIVGQRCDCLNGIATKGTKWHVMKRLSEDTILVLF